MTEHAPAKPETKEEKALALIAQGKALLRKIAQDKNKDKRKNETRLKIIMGGIALANPIIAEQIVAKAVGRDLEFIKLNLTKAENPKSPIRL